jgi:hypothetical protein
MGIGTPSRKSRIERMASSLFDELASHQQMRDLHIALAAAPHRGQTGAESAHQQRHEQP